MCFVARSSHAEAFRIAKTGFAGGLTTLLSDFEKILRIGTQDYRTLIFVS